ncbi:MAG: rhomboid family intramembrane serine protease [Bacteroidales bacterium]|nr:rhomboid family intramembrane serine protease [Bacteroidales bacterium]
MDISIKRFYISLVVPVLFVLLLWVVFLADRVLELNLYYYGIFPRKISGLTGVLLTPLIHGDFKHLMANSFPVLVLCTTLFYFYREVAFRVFFLSYLVTGLLTWVVARQAYHIGASGLLYSLAGFLIISGLIRKHIGLIAISLIVVFQYGSMIWGVFPIEERVSWESHLMGFITGITLAWIYRKRGPVGSYLFWQHSFSPEDQEEETDLPWNDYEIEGKKKKMQPPDPGRADLPHWESDWTRFE